MHEQPDDSGATRVIVAVTAAWAIVFAVSFVAAYVTEPSGDSFTRGLNRIGVFLGWHAAAGLIAIVALALGFSRGRNRRGLRWLSRAPAIIHLLLILAITAAILVARFNRPAPELFQPPGPVTAPAEPAPTAQTPPPASAAAAAAGPAADAAIETYRGIYRSGFEASHFYTIEGLGPWWLEASGDEWERLNEYYVDGPGRAGGIHVAIIADGWLEDAGDTLDYLGDFEFRLHVVSIDSIRALTAEEFDLIHSQISGL